MNNQKKGILYTGLIITFIITAVYISMQNKDDENSNHRSNLMKKTEPSANNDGQFERRKEKSISNVNFYFENSGSMNGYLDGKYFKQTMHRIKGGIEEYPNSCFFVNTEEYIEPKIWKKIDNKRIGKGHTSISDHQFIFTSAIEAAKDKQLSIVITDGIYSVNGSDIDVVEVDIENAFKKALKKNSIETVVIKMSSRYKGVYYSESCGGKPTKIDQDRPYYIVLFGNSHVIQKALNEIVITDELSGYKDIARFFVTDNIKFQYSVLTSGEEKKGSFRPSVKGGNKLVHDLVEVERSSRGGVNNIQFAIALDLSMVRLPDSYKTDVTNYSTDKFTGYKIVEMSAIDEIDPTSETFRNIQRINNLGNTVTHIITVNAVSNFYSDLNITLDNNLPNWINQTGVNDDCNIIGDTNSTFAFDHLMGGIAQAYSKVNGKEEYLEFTITFKQ